MAQVEITPTAVMAEVDRVMSAHWDWGRADCCTAACDVFLALHGVDPMQPLRNQYASALGAARLIRSWGGFCGMAASLASISGLRVGQGSPGDIGVSPAGTGDGLEGRSLLICVEAGAWAGKTLTGFAIVPTAERCWHA